jgi:hypothetical protein
MLFSKPSKKTSKIGEETAAGPEMATTNDNSKPRTTRSSKSKSSETSEAGSMKHRKASTKSPVIAQPAPVASAPEPRTMAAAAGEVAQAEIPESVMTASETGTPTGASGSVSQKEIAALAYSYWVERGYAPGSPEQDWLRAEQELSARR